MLSPTVLKFLELPIPPLAAAVVPQLAPSLVAPEGPGYLATAILGAWVVLWFLDRIGKLPGRSSAADVFTNTDRALLVDIGAHLQRQAHTEAKTLENIERLYGLLAQRDSEDGIERFLKFMQDSKGAHRTIDDICVRLERIEEGIATLQEGARG